MIDFYTTSFYLLQLKLLLISDIFKIWLAIGHIFFIEVYHSRMAVW